MINCPLNRNIMVGSGNSCNSTEMNAGVSDGLMVFNLDDIKGLVFEDDSRPDKNLFVETIITSAPFYHVDSSSIEFTEEYVDHYYDNEITATISSVSEELEQILQDAVHGRYLVVFNVIGDEHYRMVGWKEGLSLDDTLNIGSENNSYTLTFEGRTTYPMLEVDKDNFDLKNKVFEPTFVPLFEAGKVTCSDGWAVANYVVKVNAAGQALDEDNKLVQYSGKRQDAYKLNGVSDGDYNIIGTYNSTDFVSGQSVRIFDTSLCEISGSISVSPSTISLNSSTTSATITITSTDAWELITYPSTVQVSRTSGGINDQIVNVYGTDNCGTETITFRNRETRQTANVTITNDRIDIGDSYTYPNGTTNVTLTPGVCNGYTATSTIGTVTINDDGSFTIDGIPTSTNEQRITVTLVSGTETKQVELIINGSDTSAHARILSQWCEFE